MAGSQDQIEPSPIDIALARRDLGSVTQLADEHPTDTPLELAERLTGDGLRVIPRVVHLRLRAEAVQGGTFDAWVRRAMLFAFLESHPTGWRYGTNDDFRHANGFGRFSTLVGTHNADASHRAWNALLDGAEEGWRPNGPDDPAVIQAVETETFTP